MVYSHSFSPSLAEDSARTGYRKRNTRRKQTQQINIFGFMDISLAFF